MKNKYMRLKAMLLAGFFAVTSTGCAECDAKKYEETDLVISESVENFDENEDIISEEIEYSKEKIFDVGEHIISVPVTITSDGVQQYEYHEGYDVVCMSSVANGFIASGNGHVWSKTFILYVNNQPVTCKLTEIRDNQELYLSFGIPVEKEKTKTLN